MNPEDESLFKLKQSHDKLDKSLVRLSNHRFDQNQQIHNQYQHLTIQKKKKSSNHNPIKTTRSTASINIKQFEKYRLNKKEEKITIKTQVSNQKNKLLFHFKQWALPLMIRPIPQKTQTHHSQSNTELTTLTID